MAGFVAGPSRADLEMLLQARQFARDQIAAVQHLLRPAAEAMAQAQATKLQLARIGEIVEKAVVPMAQAVADASRLPPLSLSPAPQVPLAPPAQRDPALEDENVRLRAEVQSLRERIEQLDRQLSPPLDPGELDLYDWDDHATPGSPSDS